MGKFLSRFGLLILGVALSLFAYYSNSESTFLASLFGGIFILLGLLVASRSSMLGFGRNLQTINGIGTILYGKTNIDQNDHSYEATKWFTFVWLPIIPLASYRVTKMGGKPAFMGSETNFHMVDIPLNLIQIIKTYLVSYGLIALVIAFFIYSN